MNYPNRQRYEKLYRRFLHGRAADLINMSAFKEGDRVMDLCCGAGHLGLECHRRGADHVMLVDQELRMVCGDAMELVMDQECPVSWHNVTVAQMLSMLYGLAASTLDVVFCQQAVNYWICRTNAKWLSQLLKPGGQFVFNTFTEAPPQVPTIKEYTLEDGLKRIETFYMTPNHVVHHYQTCEGVAPHATSFNWFTEEELHAMLCPYFDVDLHIIEKKTAVYVCTRK